MVKKGPAALTQVRVQWSMVPADATTWKDYDVLRVRFPPASIWEDPAPQEGATVTPAVQADTPEPAADTKCTNGAVTREAGP